MKKTRMAAVLLCTLVLAVALPASAQSQASGTRQSANTSALSLEEGLLGKSIKTQNGKDVGEIEDVIFSRQGRISHVLVDIGGFLGIGEKTVSLDMNQLQLDNQDYALFKGSENDLKNMPEVDLYAFRRPYRGYYGPYGGYGPYGYDGPAGRGYGPYPGPYGGGPMQGQRNETYRPGQDQWQGRYSQQDRQSYEEQYPQRGYQDSRQGRTGMRQDQRGRMGQMQGGMNRGMSGELFLGAQVVNQRNDNLGEIEDLVIDPATGRITHAVIEVGGVLGIGEKEVLVPYNQLRQLDPYYVMYRGTQEQLEQMPEYQKDDEGRVTGLERRQNQRAGGGQSNIQQKQGDSRNQQQ